MATLVGQTLGQYQVMEQIGKGGMATVYRALQKSVNREVAIKVLPHHFMHEDTFLERFTREVEVVASLQHPHIIPIYDYGEFNEQPYIVMALYLGGTLSDLLTERVMNLSEATRAIRQAADALDYAHSKGIIHRDIKPSNFLLDEQENIYLADFGLAKVMDAGGELTGSGLLGTPNYMAPELTEKGNVAPAIDVYALGVMLFQMLTGHLPFEAETSMSMLLAHMQKQVPSILDFRADLPEKMDDIIYVAMAKSPEERFATPGAMAKELESLGSTATIESTDHTGLLFTNIQGQIIFIDGQLLKMAGYSSSDARRIIGQSMHEFLGITHADSSQLLADVQQLGQVRGRVFDILDATGEVLTIVCKGVASYDDKGASVGVDFSFVYAPNVIGHLNNRSATPSTIFDTEDKSYLEIYFTAIIDALRVLLMRFGGSRLSTNMENIINETAERNEWPVHMTDSQINIDILALRAEVYRGLLAKAINYAVSCVGHKSVIKQIRALDNQFDERAPEFAKQLGLNELFDNL